MPLLRLFLGRGPAERDYAMKKKRTRGYEHRLLMLVGRPELPPGGVSNVSVSHDGWCKSNRGKPCNCFPTITVRTATTTYLLDEQGDLISQN